MPDQDFGHATNVNSLVVQLVNDKSRTVATFNNKIVDKNITSDYQMLIPVINKSLVHTHAFGRRCNFY